MTKIDQIREFISTYDGYIEPKPEYVEYLRLLLTVADAASVLVSYGFDEYEMYPRGEAQAWKDAQNALCASLSALDQELLVSDDLHIDCPVKPPRLLRADSTVEVCASCGSRFDRYPTFMGSDDGFWRCENCGGSLIKAHKGRPYGPQSKDWEWILDQFNKLYLDISPQDRDTVLSVPPLNELDWKAIEAWYRSHNIYRSFIGVDVTVESS